MIFLDIDGTLINFYSTAIKFGIELKVNEFGRWDWGKPPYPTPEEFYAKTELQPWASNLILEILLIGELPVLITKDYAQIKWKHLNEKSKLMNDISCEGFRLFEAPNKAEHCRCPVDFLIDDNYNECEAWREKGGIAHHFDLASDSPFENFLKYWNIRK